MDTEQPNLLRLLSETRFAEGLNNEQLKSLCRASSLIRIGPGESLFREGTPEDAVYVVSSGQIRLSMHVPRRGEVSLLTAGPGDLVGWSGVLTGGPTTATATATEECELIAMSGARLRDVCADDPKLGYVLMTRIADVLARRLLATRLQLLDLYSESQHEV